MKAIKIGKLSKETDLTIFYVLNKNKTVIKNKLKKIKKETQFLAIINQLMIKKRKIIIANINPKSKN
jgi:hypothetical protein